MASASPLTAKLETLQQLEEAGAAAAVLPSLFEEQIEHEEQQMTKLYQYQSESFAESLSYFPELEDYRVGPDDYLELVREATKTLSDPVIGSLNGSSKGGWTRYAKAMQEAGADALELNIYFVPTEPLMTSTEVEQRYWNWWQRCAQNVSIPLAVKIGPNFSGLPNFATGLIRRRCQWTGAVQPLPGARHRSGGAAGRAEPGAEHRARSCASAAVDRHPARACDRVSGRDQRRPLGRGRDQAAAGRGRRHDDGLRAADARARADHADCAKNCEAGWKRKSTTSVEQMKGSMSRANCPDPSALERGNYMKALASYTSEFSA